MRLLIEGHSYKADHVRDICGGMVTDSADDKGMVKVSHIGYFFNPAINDCVLFLPKVVSDNGGETAFGGIAPDTLIDAFSQDNCLSDRQSDFVRNFSLWTYRTISTFARLNPDSTIVSRHQAASAQDSEDAPAGTLLDIVLEIIHFYNANRDYFMYVIRNLHSGYDRISWRRTISTKLPVLQDNAPIYMDVVNRRKQIDFDEELMVIFHSILHYISENLGLAVQTECSYELITGARFEAYMDGLGLIRLNAIRHKYFSDKDVRLWKLCRDFFTKTAGLHSRDNESEYLIVSNFEKVFEAMVDAIVGDSDLPDLLKNQEDGKIVDHIFRHKSPLDGKDIYYIGDSKYYAVGSEVGDNSIYKQFTYAKNIIQYHFIQSMRGKLEDFGYRDPLTEGYNFTPNFFISAYMPDSLSYENADIRQRGFSGNAEVDGKWRNEDDRHRLSHFPNRLFDRDTLYLTHFDINLLFVMSLYAADDSAEQSAFKDNFKSKIHNAFQRLLSSRYTFYELTPPENMTLDEFVSKHFRLLNGKIYTVEDKGCAGAKVTVTTGPNGESGTTGAFSSAAATTARTSGAAGDGRRRILALEKGEGNSQENAHILYALTSNKIQVKETSVQEISGEPNAEPM